MAADRFTITYSDGSTEDVTRRPVHWMRAERLTTKDSGAYTAILSSLWAASTGGMGQRSDFEAWAESVDDWDKLEGDDARPPATTPGTSPG